MIRLVVLGDIGAGKSHIAKLFGYPVFNADLEVSKIYKTNKIIFKKIKKKIPGFFSSFPINKNEMIEAISSNKINLKKITNIVHPKVRLVLKKFLRKNKNKKFVILDIPLILENKLNKKSDILIFVQSKKSEINKRLKKRKNFNKKLLRRFKEIQLPLELKKKKSKFIIKNNFTYNSVNKSVNYILKKLKND
tara:strand:+ start:2677 stop:3252 length:576 start_codon:yes stop_codon:yes gene_type:complete